MRDAGVVHAAFHERRNVRAVRDLQQPLHHHESAAHRFQGSMGPLVRLRVRNEDFWCLDFLMLAWIRHR